MNFRQDDEWEIHHELLQSQDNFDSAAGEGEAGGPTDRGRLVHAAVRRSKDRAGSAGADGRQAASRMQRKRRMQDGKLKRHKRLEKFKELGQTVASH